MLVVPNWALTSVVVGGVVPEVAEGGVAAGTATLLLLVFAVVEVPAVGRNLSICKRVVGGGNLAWRFVMSIGFYWFEGSKRLSVVLV